MKSWRLVVALWLGLILASATACNPFDTSKQQETSQLAKVRRGNLTVNVSGSGNINFVEETKLSFSSGGKIEKIYVKEGDNFSKGAALAKLDTSALELALTQANGAVFQAQLAVRTAEYNLDKAQNRYRWPDLEIAYADVDRARYSVTYANDRLREAPAGQQGDWAALVARAEVELAIAERKLRAMLSNADTDEVALSKLQVDVAKSQLKVAERSAAEAQKTLDEATLTAPFDGIVAEVPVKEGDIVPLPTMLPNTVIHLVDPTRMELKVEVDEIDIASVKPGQRATIDVDALPALKLEGKVSFISLLPIQKGGVVMYEVKITFNVPADSGLRAGMSATADIVVVERGNVLLVPSRAIKQDSQGNNVVEIMVNGQSQQKPVVTGISDGFDTEIIEGLQEGDTVVIEAKAKPKTSGTGLF